MTTRASITPLKQEISLGAGDKVDLEITIFNLGDEVMETSLVPEPLSVEGENYDLNLSTMTNRTKIVDWIKFPEGSRFSVPVGESVTVPFRVEVPEDAPSGGQYAVLAAQFWSNNIDSSHLATVGAIAMRLYAQIAGENVIEGKILSNEIPAIVIGDGFTAHFEAENTGNLDFYVNDTFRVVDFFSHKILYDDAETAEPSVMFPETTRFLTNEWQGVGIYNVTQNVSLLDETSEQTGTVIVIPVWLVVVFGLAVVAGIWGIIWKITKKKRLKKINKFKK